MLTSTPNLLTLGRVAVIPAVVACFYFPGELARYLACFLFTVAAITDYLDGYLARSWQQQSPFGRWLDPIADKLLVGATILMLVGLDRAPVLPSLVILLREITVSGLREYMAEVSVGLPVSRLAKWKTAMQMVAIGVLIVGEAGPAWLPVRAIGDFGLWLAAVLTLVTGWDYLHAGIRHMLEEREPRRPEPAAVPSPSITKAESA
jgi:cardiolipin synthase